MCHHLYIAKSIIQQLNNTQLPFVLCRCKVFSTACNKVPTNIQSGLKRNVGGYLCIYNNYSLCITCFACMHTDIHTPSCCGFWHSHPDIPLHFWKMFFILLHYTTSIIMQHKGYSYDLLRDMNCYFVQQNSWTSSKVLAHGPT